MKNLKISTALLALALLGMSMGFPHQATDEEGNTATSSYSGFMSCTPQHSQIKQEEKPVADPQVKKAGAESEACQQASSNLVNHSARIISRFIKK